MRISKIKLAGFKSFVDPTTLHLPGNLTGIVGPNGCGKSNIIDALQWVMGESSAKQLRGDSMADVIFSGSSTRKPVGQASVELVFDNSDGAIGGQYASFAEISIKRTVGRDGVSTYFLNGTKCRRKDVTDVFLGTGLGARGGYSVIEQGMISRVVEAKPEELRGFLEEAAGISKYKERRRETENRIRHTQDNLERVNDIREELAKQLTHLQRQAKAAEKYQAYKSEERRIEAELLALRWRAIEADRAAQSHEIMSRENAVEAALADLRRIEAEQVELRAAQAQALEDFNARQSEFYTQSATIARLEQALQHNEERRKLVGQDLERVRASLEEASGLLAQDRVRLAETEEALARLEPDDAAQAGAEQRCAETLRQAEQAAEAWQQAWDRFQSEHAETARLEHAEQVRGELLERRVGEARQRFAALGNELAGLATDEGEETLRTLEAELAESEDLRARLLEEQQAARRGLETARETLAVGARALHEGRVERERLLGEQASLTALQTAALGRDRRPLQDWLAAHGLDQAELLASAIEIEAGWERAVETALRVPLSAVCGGDVIDRALAGDRGTVPAERLGAVDASPVAPGSRRLPDVPLLVDKLKGPWPLHGLLAGVYAVEDLAAARALRPRLAAHESVVLRDGTWLGPNWLVVPGQEDRQAGVLARERTLDELEARIEALAATIAERQRQLDEGEAEAAACEQRERELAAEINRVVAHTAELKARASRIEGDIARRRERHAEIETERAALARQADEDDAALAALRERLQGMRERLQSFEAERERLTASRREVHSALDAAREAWRQAREARHQVALKLEGLRSTRSSLLLAIERNERLTQELGERCASLEAALREAVEPQAQLRAELDVALDERIAGEQALAASRERLDELGQTLRNAEETRAVHDRTLAECRRALEQARLDDRALAVRAQEQRERLEQTGHEMEAVLAGLPPDAAEEPWRERLSQVAARIARLGPINLAAIDEFAQLTERKSYLDSQYEDLQQALATLEDAMRKIDRETRTRFKETFDQVNTGLQRMFPLLFGGGHAYLELTGEDLLETGVAVMARPPGKRNSTIHLLSGGEKALTALAFVFALFELNPAPFCLLDEVDAPLDDANVVRLTDMLRQMSERVQFLFVTHNKITMEIAEQLIGVTMQEAGVSRLVSVNMDEAVALAETA